MHTRHHDERAELDEPPVPGGGLGDALMDVALVISERLRLLIVAPLLVGALVLGLTYALTPSFTARAVILPPQQQQSAASAALQNLGALAGLAGAAAGIKSPADQYIALMQSRTLQDRLIDRFELMAVYKAKLRLEARKRLDGRTRIAAGKKDGLISIEVDDTDPQRAADIANAYVAELRRLTTELALTEAQQRRVFFEKQLAQTKDRFSAAQKALQSSGFNEGALRAEPRATAEGYARLRAEVTALEVRLQAMRVSLTDSAPEVRQAQEQLGVLRGQLAKAETASTGASQGDYVDRYREYKYQEALFELFSRQFEIAKIDESREGAVIQVVDQAAVPEQKSWPKRFVSAAVAVAVTAMLLLVWLVLRAAVRNAGPEIAVKSGQLRNNLRAALFLRGRTR